MKTDELDRLRTVAPDKQAGLFTASERQALFAAICGTSNGRPADRRPRSVLRWAYRLTPVAAAGATAAVIAIASGGQPAPATIGHPGRSHKPEARTVAYVTRHVREALASETHGSLRSTITAGPDITKAVENLRTGAVRFTIRTSSDGALVRDFSSTGGDNPTSTFVDYTIRSWWRVHRRVVSISQITDTPQMVRAFLREGVAVVAGDGTIDGHKAIHLHLPSTWFTKDGKKYIVLMSEIWVSARMFLPVRVVGLYHGWTENLSWSARPPTRAEVTAVPPAGFTRIARQPDRPSPGHGNG